MNYYNVTVIAATYGNDVVTFELTVQAQSVKHAVRVGKTYAEGRSAYRLARCFGNSIVEKPQNFVDCYGVER